MVYEFVWKGIVGGILTALIVIASKKGDVLPGILPLAPTFAIIALIAVGAKGDPAGFRTTALAGMKTIPAYFTFLLVAWYLVSRFDYKIAIIGGMVAWFAVVGLIFYITRNA
ncbi:GlpM family protein [Fulvimarina sp. MAC8]|uniref:GlpM family protein n=1 Tax=Fulvimarina sp. MAC8 TaxID=3162874 RepID=UPI0032EEE9F7